MDRSLASVGVAIACAALLLALLLPGFLRALVSLPILLIAPGYALQLACGRRVREADPWLTVCLSLVLSVALLPLLVLLVYTVERPLSSVWIVAAVAITTLALAGLGAWRYPDHAPPAVGEQSQPSPWSSARAAAVALVVLATLGRTGLEAWSSAETAPTVAGGPVGGRPALPLRAVAAVVVLACTGGVIAITWAVLPGSTPSPYSAIALAGTWSKAHRVTVVPPGKRLDVDVRVENHTATTQRYEIVPTLKGANWSRSSVALASGRSWSGSVSGTVPSGGCLHRLLIRLKCQNDACPQSLVLWVTARAALPARCSTSGAHA